MQNSAKNYAAIINQLAQESSEASWSNGYAMALIMVSLAILATAATCFFAPFAGPPVIILIFLAEGIALFTPVGLYYHKAGAYMMDRCLELENTHPGIIDAYEDWKRTERENAISTTNSF